MVYGERSWTVEESAFATRRLAQLLAQAGVSQGDRVMLVSRNSPYHFLLYIACARLGAVFVPVSYRLTASELQALVDFTAPRVVVADAHVAGLGPIQSLGSTVSFVIDDDAASGPLAPALENGYFALSAATEVFDGELIADGEVGSEELNRQGYPAGTAALFFTAGSAAGRPRAVELTHTNMWWANRNFREGIGYHSDDVVLVTTPMHHIGGFNGGALDLFTSGGRVVIMRSFNAAEALRLIDEHKVTAMFAVPAVYSLLLEAQEKGERNVESLRILAVGGAAVPPELLAKLGALGHCPINVWGTTETAGTGTFLPWGRGALGSIGRPFAYVEARIVDANGEDATEGELLVRGPSVSAGYWHNEEANAAAYQHGWLRTGDIARIDGDLTIIGRTSPKISTGGETVHPEEVEAVLREYPGIADVVVVGIPDSRWGQEVVAVVVPEGEAPTLDELSAFAGRVLSRYKLPRRIVIAEAIARDAEGRASRAEVAAAVVAADEAGAEE